MTLRSAIIAAERHDGRYYVELLPSEYNELAALIDRGYKNTVTKISVKKFLKGLDNSK